MKHEGINPHLRRVARFGSAALLVGTLGLAACGSDDGNDATPTTTASAQALPPVIVQIADSDGTTVDVAVGKTVDLVSDDPVTDWTAEIADPAIVEFVAGREDAYATFNPGLLAKSAGETSVKLTNSSSGTTTTFTVRVSAS